MADAVLPPEERDALAAELALGLLDGDERAAALRLKLADPGFAAAVEAWSQRLEPLCGGFAEAPPPGIWPAIERRLADREVAAMLATPSVADPALRRWRWGAIGSGLVAAGLALVLVLRPLPEPRTQIVEVQRPPEQLVVAALDGGPAGGWLAANYDPAAGALRIRAIQMPATRLTPELWVIPADGVPRSLGLLAATGVSNVTVAAPIRALMQEGATLAVSLEAADTAPHTAPSSTPIAMGKISTI